MHELGIRYDRPYRKCARIVGDTMGKYHPHGDLSLIHIYTKKAMKQILSDIQDGTFAKDFLVDMSNAGRQVHFKACLLYTSRCV